MRKLALTVAVVTGLLFPLPSQAEAPLDAAKKIALIPVKSAGCFVALAVGTPIAIGRLSVKRYKEHMVDVADMEGASAGVIYAIPMGFGEGLAHGLYYGPRNAISNFDKPFSKESMSLGESVMPDSR